jgi:putative zinc-binding metallo-peptidase
VASNRAVVNWLRKSRAAPRGQELARVGQPVDHPELRKVVEDLAWLGIKNRFKFVWSDDGSGVEEDAPTVIHVLGTLVKADEAPPEVHAAAERVVALDLGGVVRHELGHSLLFQRPLVARSPGFRRLFGDVGVTYRVGNPVDEVLRRLARGGLRNPRYRRVVSLYAATHPHEKFAEAVRVALAYRGDERELEAWSHHHDTDPVVLDQLLFAGSFLRTWSG